jgi:hypothetical protein
MDPLGNTILIGIGATALTDLWALARRRWLGVPLPDFGLVGRWLGHMPRGRFRHEAIGKAAPVRGERVIGWTMHYLIGIAFAALLVGVCGTAWLLQPSAAPALVVGIATVATPWLLMQPGMGAGIAASRTPRPNAARMHSLLTHAVFGLGLYASACAVAALPVR